MCNEQNMMNELFSSYSLAPLKLLLSITHTLADVYGNIDLLCMYVLRTETFKNNQCGLCNNPSYVCSEKRSDRGNKQCAGFYYSHMTKTHSLSGLTVHRDPGLTSWIRNITHPRILLIHHSMYSVNPKILFFS